MNTHALHEGEKSALRAIVNLVLLGSAKLAVGLFTGIPVVIAAAISAYSDILGIFASYIGLHLSRKSANQKFEYGYYKIETITALVVSLGIIYLGYYIAQDGIELLLNPVKGQHFTFALTITVFSIFNNGALSRQLKLAGEKVNSLSLKANARDKAMDMIAEIGVLISIIANYKGIPYVEGVITLIIAVIILKEGLTSTKESIFFLLDYWDDPKLVRQIHKIFREEQDLVQKVKKLRLRRAGTFIFGEAFVEINPFAGIEDLREELSLLSQKIKNLNPYIKDFAIYSHIPKADHLKVAIPIKKGRTLSACVANSLRQTNAYLFAEIRNNKLKKFYVKKLPSVFKQTLELANFLKKEKVQILIDNKLNSLVYYNLRRTHHILIYPNFENIKYARETLNLLLIDT